MNEFEGLVYPMGPPLRGFNHPWNEARYIIIGFPFDGTSSYRPGTRFGPLNIRLSSLMIESMSLFSKLSIDEIPIYDIGDVTVVHGNVTESLKRLKSVIELVLNKNKKPMVIGGEHTLTLGVLNALKRHIKQDEFCLVSLDAHMDLYDEWPLGQRVSHATTLRRSYELLGNSDIIIVGVRACDPEEITFAEEHNIKYISSFDIDSKSTREVLLERIKDKQVYLSLDIDVLDPSIAPGVGNPEAGGLNYHTLLKLLKLIIQHSKEMLGFDLVEFNPLVDMTGTTSVIATRLLYEVLSLDYPRSH